MGEEGGGGGVRAPTDPHPSPPTKETRQGELTARWLGEGRGG